MRLGKAVRTAVLVSPWAPRKTAVALGGWAREAQSTRSKVHPPRAVVGDSEIFALEDPIGPGEPGAGGVALPAGTSFSAAMQNAGATEPLARVAAMQAVATFKSVAGRLAADSRIGGSISAPVGRQKQRVREPKGPRGKPCAPR